MMSELWRDVVGYEGQYQVSSFGNVRNLNWRAIGRIRNLTPCPDRDGYLSVCLSDERGGQKSFRVHRLVAEAFLDTFRPELQVNHIDENKKNNSICNLECVTPYENNNHGTRNARVSKNKRNTNAIKIRQLSLDGKEIKVWESGHEIKRQLGFDNTHISRVCKGQKQTGYGFRWEFVTNDL